MGDEPSPLDPSERPRRLTAELISRLEKIYATGGRTLRRWWNLGAPLHDPAAMPEWWNRTMTWTLPERIAAAAQAAAPVPGPISETGVVVSPEKAGSNVKPEESIRISEYRLEEGEAVQLQRSIVKALFTKLSRAYEVGEGIDVAQKRYDRAAESLRKLEASDRLAKKQTGELLPLQVVRAEIYTMLELLRSMRENMPRKVFERVPDLPAEWRDKVKVAIIHVREGEDLIFRNLHQLRGPNDVANASVS